MYRKSVILLGIMSLTIISLAQSPPNDGQYWNSLSNDERVAFLSGYNHGLNDFLLEIYGILPEMLPGDSIRQREFGIRIIRIMDEYYINDEVVDFTTLGKTTQNLYEDPANSYIALSDMIKISSDKIRGEIIDQKLIEARKTAIKLRNFYKTPKK